MQSHETLCETRFEKLCAFSPVTAPVRCRLWNVEWGGMQSLECEESGVLSGECNVCRVWSRDCEVESVECGV